MGCDGCGAKLSISHILNYKNNGLISNCNNDLRGGVAYPDRKDFTNLNINSNLLMNTERDNQGKKDIINNSPGGQEIANNPM